MTFLDFCDKHWGFWFAVFLLCALATVTHGVVTLIACLVVRRTGAKP